MRPNIKGDVYHPMLDDMYHFEGVLKNKMEQLTRCLIFPAAGRVTPGFAPERSLLFIYFSLSAFSVFGVPPEETASGRGAIVQKIFFHFYFTPWNPL